MIVCAGGCGAKVSARIPLGKDVIVIGGKLDLQHAPSDVVSVQINVGSDTGAHRDHLKAYNQLANGSNREKLIKLLEAVKNIKRPPVVVYGLCGATGLALARAVVDNVPSVNVVVLPHPNEPEAEMASEKLRFILAAKKARNSVFYAITPRAELDNEAIENAARTAVDALRREKDFDAVINHARNDIHWLDDARTGLGGIKNYVKTVVGASEGKLELVARDNCGADVDLSDLADGDDGSDDLWDII